MKRFQSDLFFVGAVRGAAAAVTVVSGGFATYVRTYKLGDVTD